MRLLIHSLDVAKLAYGSMSKNKYLCTLINILIVIWVMFPSNQNQENDQSLSLSERYKHWKRKYRDIYKDDAEEEKHFQIFKHNVAYIDNFNAAGNKPYKLAINGFADQPTEASDDGFKKRKREPTTSFKYKNFTDIPAAIDWRKRGAVTPVKNQRRCGKHKRHFFSVSVL